MSFKRVTLVALAAFFSIGMTQLASACCAGWGYAAPVAYAPVGYGGGCGGCGAPTVAAVYAEPVAPTPLVAAPIYVTPQVLPTGFGGPCCGYNGCGNCGYGGDWSGGCGSCGGAVAWGGGCGNCGGAVGWGGGCGGCGGGWSGGCGGCGVTAYAAPSLYVVNQGPSYEGPGLTVPYQTYAPETSYVPATNYPYVPGYGYGGGGYPRPYYGAGYGYAPRYGYRPRYGYGARYGYRGAVYAHAGYRPGPRYYGGGGGWRRYP
jgi:hypothetical protein